MIRVPNYALRFSKIYILKDFEHSKIFEHRDVRGLKEAWSSFIFESDSFYRIWFETLLVTVRPIMTALLERYVLEENVAAIFRIRENLIVFF